jgi:hypothetical protein
VNTYQILVATIGAILVVLTVVEYWKPEFKAAI